MTSKDIKEYCLILIPRMIDNNEEYLLYYDDEWNCWFLPNYKVTLNVLTNDLCNKISKQLGVTCDGVSLEYVNEGVQRKFSEVEGKENTYKHYLYLANIKNLPKIFGEKEFEFRDTKYKWMSLYEMENDKSIESKNGEVINFVKESLAKKETEYLNSIPGLVDSINEIKERPKSKFLTEEEAEW